MSINDMAQFNSDLIAQFRAEEGDLKDGVFKGAPILLLTTTGAKSGKSYTTPLAYSRDGDRLIVIASKGGAPSNPAWYHNLVANPITTVEVGADKYDARAVVAEGEERDRLFDAQAALMPNFADYQRATTRRIPVVVL